MFIYVNCNFGCGNMSYETCVNDISSNWSLTVETDRWLKHDRVSSANSTVDCEIVKQANFMFTWLVQTMIWNTNEMSSEVGTSAKKTSARLISEETKGNPGGHVSLKR